MSKTAIVPFAVRSSTLVGVPCTMSILAAKLARLVCCHLLVSLSSQRMKLPWRARLDYAAAKARGVWCNAGPPASPPLGGWTWPKTQRLQRTFLTAIFAVHFRGLPAILLRAGVHLLSLLPSHVPLALLVPRFVFRSYPCAAFCPGIAELLHVHLSIRPRASRWIHLCTVGPVLSDCFFLWVVLREARSQRFAWAFTVSQCLCLTVLDRVHEFFSVFGLSQFFFVLRCWFARPQRQRALRRSRS